MMPEPLMQSIGQSAAVGAGANVAIIILTLNQREKTLRCLQSLRDVKNPSHRVLLWDNGSTDGTEEAVHEMFPEVYVHRHTRNLGVASGRNAAAELAMQQFSPRYLMFLDNDMIVTPEFLSALMEPFERNKTLGQAQAKIRLNRDPERLNDGGGNQITFWLGRTRPVGYGEIDRGQYDTPTKCVACGGAMLVRSDVFCQLGGFDAIFNPFGPEDLDFSLRLTKAGYGALYVPQSLVFHDISQTFEGGQYTEKYARNKARLWFIFMRRHASPLQQLGFMFLGAPYLVMRVLLREGRKGNLASLRGLGQGLLDFWRSSMRRKSS